MRVLVSPTLGTRNIKGVTLVKEASRCAEGAVFQFITLPEQQKTHQTHDYYQDQNQLTNQIHLELFIGFGSHNVPVE